MNTSFIYTQNGTINGLLSQLDETISTCKFNLKMNRRCLVKHNTIIEIGAYTISSDNGKVKLKLGNNPSKWCSEGVKEVMKIEFKNGFDKVIKPKKYNHIEWYKKELRKAWNTRKDMLMAFHLNENK
jgi:hypothetical protein